MVAKRTVLDVIDEAVAATQRVIARRDRAIERSRERTRSR
jgi:hypothetical protein